MCAECGSYESDNVWVTWTDTTHPPNECPSAAFVGFLMHLGLDHRLKINTSYEKYELSFRRGKFFCEKTRSHERKTLISGCISYVDFGIKFEEPSQYEKPR